MKPYILTLTLGMLSLLYTEVHAQDIFGLWWTTDKESMIEVYECNGKLCGKVVHVPNPDPQGKRVEGKQLLSDFVQKKDNVWKKGRIYDPRKDKSYKAKLTLKGDELKVRGYVGISLFGKTKTWTRVENDPRK